MTLGLDETLTREQFLRLSDESHRVILQAEFRSGEWVRSGESPGDLTLLIEPSPE